MTLFVAGGMFGESFRALRTKEHPRWRNDPPTTKSLSLTSPHNIRATGTYNPTSRNVAPAEVTFQEYILRQETSNIFFK